MLCKSVAKCGRFHFFVLIKGLDMTLKVIIKQTNHIIQGGP